MKLCDHKLTGSDIVLGNVPTQRHVKSEHLLMLR